MMRRRAQGALFFLFFHLSCGFHTPYRPEDSRHFQILSSQTFAADPRKRFDLSYADGTVLKGFNGIDVVRIGDVHGKAPFGLLYECNSPDFNGDIFACMKRRPTSVDGILGFGLPKPGEEGKQLPRPILWALTDPSNSESNAKELGRKFSFFSTDDVAELQLGGYDPATCTEAMVYTPSLSATDFIVGVTSLKYGESMDTAQELLQFNQPTGGEYLPAIMDSGTSCLVIPGDNLQGRLVNTPFDDFTAAWSREKSFFITIGGKHFTVPYSSWYLARTNQTCVQPSPVGMQGLLIGDVFFRSYLVEFDMTSEVRPIIGISPLNVDYRTLKESRVGYFKENKVPVQKLMLLRGEETMFQAEHSERLNEVDKVPIFNKKGTQYFIDLHIGTPGQPFTLIFDTGSAVFGVFTSRAQLPADISAQLLGASEYHVREGAMASLMVQGPIGFGSGQGPSETLHVVGRAGAASLSSQNNKWGAALHGQAVSMALAGAQLSRGVGDAWDMGWARAAALSIAFGIAAFGVALRVRKGLHRRREQLRQAHLLEGSYGGVCTVVTASQNLA